jgi:murein L,D-transpeptidase YafK
MQWILTLVLWSAASLSASSPPDRIMIHKRTRILELMHAGKVIKTYKIALGGNPVGPKMRQGDHKTPEGNYIIDSRNLQSQFHRSLHISYPMLTIVHTLAN